MADKPQQQTLSVRISEVLRQRLERAKQLVASKTGKSVSTSEIAKLLLESAREERLEIVDLMDQPTKTLLEVQRKGKAQHVLPKVEWAFLSFFVQQGLEAFSSDTPSPVSRESIIAVLDAFLAVYELRRGPSSRDDYYLKNLTADFPSTHGSDSTASVKANAELVRRAAKEVRTELANPASKREPLLVGRNLHTLLEDEITSGGEKLDRVLRPYWVPLWRLAARGHYYMSNQPVREEPRTLEERFNREAIPPVSLGGFTLSFARGEGNDFSALITFPGIRGPLYPIGDYPAMAEFRRMLDGLDTGGSGPNWKGKHFFAYVIGRDKEKDIGFRARENGITLTLTGKEWEAMRVLFHRAWQVPEVRELWDGLIDEYGEL